MQQMTLDLAPPTPPTLANFVPGANAQVLAALAAGLAPASRERLVLWGGRGSGKSHLLRGFAAAARAGGANAHYLACAGLTDAARDIDALPASSYAALDDIDRLDDAAQVALFNLINRRDADAAAATLLVSCAQTPKSQALRADLATRLMQGLVLEVAALSDEDKAAALTQHARQRGITLPAEVTQYLLAHLARDLPTLVAVLDALDKVSLQQKRPITVPLLREVLQNPLDIPARR
jgi:DnaA family protein